MSNETFIMPTDPILPRPYFDGKVTTIHAFTWSEAVTKLKYLPK